MCSVRLLIRTVKMEICTSGEPESDSSRRYSVINSRFRSLVTVICFWPSNFRAAFLQQNRGAGATYLLPLLQLTGTIPQDSNNATNYKRINVSGPIEFARAEGTGPSSGFFA